MVGGLEPIQKCAIKPSEICVDENVKKFNSYLALDVCSVKP
jgi:hypothetical protein